MATDLHDTPDKTEHATRQNLTAVVAEYFTARPNTWIDGREIQQIAGAYAWRTRISNVRHAPYFLNIQNRQRRIATSSGSFTVSEYKPVVETVSVNTTKEEEIKPETTGLVSGYLF